MGFMYLRTSLAVSTIIGANVLPVYEFLFIIFRRHTSLEVIVITYLSSLQGNADGLHNNLRTIIWRLKTFFSYC